MGFIIEDATVTALRLQLHMSDIVNVHAEDVGTLLLSMDTLR